MRCDACAVEQHRRLPLLPFLAFYVTVVLVMVFAVVMQARFPRYLPMDLALLVPMLAVFVAWERFLFRRGEMVATVPWRKRLVMAVLYSVSALFVAAFAFFVHDAAP